MYDKSTNNNNISKNDNSNNTSHCEYCAYGDLRNIESRYGHHIHITLIPFIYPLLYIHFFYILNQSFLVSLSASH